MRFHTLSCLLLAAVGVQGRHEHPTRHRKADLGWTCVNVGQSTGMKTVGYFGNWVSARPFPQCMHRHQSLESLLTASLDSIQDIYGANYRITDVPAEQLTHLTYSFANINTTTGAM